RSLRCGLRQVAGFFAWPSSASLLVARRLANRLSKGAKSGLAGLVLPGGYAGSGRRFFSTIRQLFAWMAGQPHGPCQRHAKRLLAQRGQTPANRAAAGDL